MTSYCSNKTNTCSCITGYAENSDNSSCILNMIGSQCDSSDSTDCSAAVAYSTCSSNSTCVCIAGYYAASNSTECLPHHLNTHCYDSPSCAAYVADSECSNMYCTCVQGYIAEGIDTCRVMTVEDPCNSTLQCQTAVNNSYCGSNATCDCLTGYASKYNGSACYKNNITSPCIGNSDCLIQDSSCVNQTCACNLGYYVGNNNTECLPHQLNTHCYDTPNCAAYVASSECSNMYCSCMQGYIAEGIDICRVLTVEDPCNSTVQCQTAVNNSYCGINATCDCLTGYASKYNGSECHKNNITSPCTADSDCLIQESSCLNQTCACNLGYYVSNNNTECLPHYLNTHCYDTPNCAAYVSSSECNDMYCTCAQGFIAEGIDTCREMTVEDPCNSTTQCQTFVNNSFCGANETCECFSGFASKLNGSSCYRNNITSPCTADSQCASSIHNSSCVNLQCKCHAGFYPSHSGTQCTPYHVHDPYPCNSSAAVDDCSVSVQHSSCYNSTCLCDRGYRPTTYNTTCTLLILNVGCTSWDQACETAIGNSACITG